MKAEGGNVSSDTQTQYRLKYDNLETTRKKTRHTKFTEIMHFS